MNKQKQAKKRSRESLQEEYKKIFFWPDTHVPYHSKQAVELAFKACQSFKPDILVVGGDLFDFYCVSDHSKDPRRKDKLVDELIGAASFRQLLENLAPQRVFLEGNHENRLERYLWTRAPELFGLVSVQTLLGLKEWTFIPYRSHYKIGSLYLCHTAGPGGKYATHKAHDLYQHNVGFFHTHNLGVAYSGNATGTTHVSANFGWLGDIHKVDYTTNIEKLRRYLHGFGTGYLFPKGDVHIQAHAIVNKRVILEGQVITL